MSKRTRLINIESLLQRIDAAIVVRDLGSTRAADAYEGLRKQIVQSGKSHRTHTAHLLSLADSLERGADMELIRDRVSDFMEELGLKRIYDTGDSELFELKEGEGSGLECIEPAIVEQLADGKRYVVRQGIARRVPGPPEPENKLFGSLNAEIDNNRQINSRNTLLIATASLVVGLLLGFLFFKDKNESPIIFPVITTTTEANS